MARVELTRAAVEDLDRPIAVLTLPVATDLGAHDLSDDTLIEIAGTGDWVVVTENAVETDLGRPRSCRPMTVMRAARW